MSWLKWIVISLAAVEPGWMVFDGGRAFALGDYVTPNVGPYQGQLGPGQYTNIICRRAIAGARRS